MRSPTQATVEDRLPKARRSDLLSEHEINYGLLLSQLRPLITWFGRYMHGIKESYMLAEYETGRFVSQRGFIGVGSRTGTGTRTTRAVTCRQEVLARDL
jgi:hypothetical protein